MNAGSNLKIGPLVMRQFDKKYFPTYSDAIMWLDNTNEPNDGIIRRESEGKYYIFVEQKSQKKQTV